MADIFSGSFFGGLASAIGSIYGANQNAQAQEQINAQNIAEQERFAQNSIQWKVADAKAAGINPLAALGAPTSSFSNVVAPQPGAGFSSAGQAIGRALSALQSPEDRAADTAAKVAALDKTQAEADYYRSMALKNVAPGNPPPVVSTSPVQPVPFKPTMTGDDPGTVAGSGPGTQIYDLPGGAKGVTPPHDIASLGFFHPASLAWYISQGIMPYVNSDYRPKEVRDMSQFPLMPLYYPTPEWRKILGRVPSEYQFVPGP